MFQRVIIATTPWTVFPPIEKCVKNLKEFGTEKLYLLQCLQEKEIPGINLELTKKLLKPTIVKQKKSLENAGFDVEPKICVESAQKEIHTLALEENCSLVVLESSKDTRFYELLFGGNIASEKIQRQTLPILLIPTLSSKKQESFIEEDTCKLLKHILFLTDFSVNAEHAFSYLKRLIEKKPQQVTLLHIQNKTFISPHLTYRLDEFNKIDALRLKKLKNEILSDNSTKVNVEIRYGHPVKEIIAFSASNQVSLIVMGKQGRGFLKEVFIGSISQNVARLSESPVLLIPMPEKDRYTIVSG